MFHRRPALLADCQWCLQQDKYLHDVLAAIKDTKRLEERSESSVHCSHWLW